ncbi:AEC family transporter [Anaerobacillus sp. MEB173]|uniref:AEC family transporter n=1 Tax=Anaerobacillus sp. MEB173 TaxID=3383345 RepID=UPI003F8F0626
MTIFIEVVLPVTLVFLIGFLVQKWRNIDIRTLSTVAIYILTPCLVFRTFYTTPLDMNYAYMVYFSLILLFAIILINKIYAKIRNYSQSLESGLILSTAFMNSGNYGAPIILFAYGTAGFDYAVSLMVLQAIIMNFFGVYYAAKGTDGIMQAIKSVMQMPATYAVILALLLKAFTIEMPSNLFMTIDLIAEATIPMVMVILGMQLAEIKWLGFQWSKIWFGVILRLAISPLIAFFIVLAFPMDPLLAKVLIVSAAMPTAATTAIYAVQFNSEPKLVSSITLITTLISVVTITLLLAILG